MVPISSYAAHHIFNAKAEWYLFYPSIFSNATQCPSHTILYTHPSQLFIHIVHTTHLLSPASRPEKSRRPCPHPVLHLSSHLPQSNTSFPSFTLTALCASHIQRPNSSLELTLGAFPSCFIQDWKSPAQCQQGYSFAKVCMKVVVSRCVEEEGEMG